MKILIKKLLVLILFSLIITSVTYIILNSLNYELESQENKESNYQSYINKNQINQN